MYSLLSLRSAGVVSLAKLFMYPDTVGCSVAGVQEAGGVFATRAEISTVVEVVQEYGSNDNASSAHTRHRRVEIDIATEQTTIIYLYQLALTTARTTHAIEGNGRLRDRTTLRSCDPWPCEHATGHLRQ